MTDILIRDLLRSQLHAAKQHGLIHNDYTANPAMIAALALDACGNADDALRMLVAASSYLRAVQKEPERAPKSDAPVGEVPASNDVEAKTLAEWEKIFG